MSCKECDIVTVPYVAYESAQIRSHRTIRLLIISLIVAIALMFTEAGVFTWLWSQYDYASIDVEAEQGEGNDNENVNVIIGDNNK